MAKTTETAAETAAAVPEETKRQKFERLARSRTEKALSSIAMLGGLTAKNNYDYTDAHWDAILKALEAEVIKLSNKVKNPNAAPEVGFSFGEVPATPAT